MAKDANISDKKVNFSTEIPFEEMFSEEAEERERLNGGPYCKGWIPIENMFTVVPDMEAMIDARRASAPPEEFEVEMRCQDARWVDFHPKMADLKPFYTIMAVSGGDFPQPGFSSTPSARACVKITHHRGGKTVRPKKETSP